MMKSNPSPAAPQKVTDRFLLRMLWRYLAPHKWMLAFVFLLLVVSSNMSVLLPYLIKEAVDGPIEEEHLEGLLPYGAAYFATIAILFILRFAYTYLLQTVGQNALLNLRQGLFEHILRQDMAFFNKTPVGQLVSRLSNDIEALTELLSTSIVMVASNMITLVGIIVAMLLLNWQLALLSLAVLPIMTGATYYARRKIREASGRYHRVVGDYLAYINEQFNGMLIVQLFGQQSGSRQHFNRINEQHRNVHMNLRDSYTVYASILQFLTTVGLALVLYGGGRGVLSDWVTLGTLIAFIEYTRRSFEPILNLSEQFAQIQTALSAGERIALMLAVQPTIVEAEEARTLHNFRGEVTFEHVTFSYQADQIVLDDVHVCIPAGQRVAIVGATGAGKSSMVGLLARYYDVQKGSIQIDGIDVRDLSHDSLHQHVTVIPQNPYCFQGTIADNLRLFNPDISQETMEQAARVAYAAPFIERLPGSYDFTLLPGGANLSQGQRQLLALARALIHNPQSVLVLDEATSNIDTETEELIQAGLTQVLRGRTSLIIAHRLSTVRDADRILVIQNGRIVEDGNHGALLAQGGIYAGLYQKQFMELEPV